MPRPRSREKGEQVLAAATELFATRGFAQVSVPEVASAAGVGLGTLYLRFPSKEALGNTVFRWSKQAWAAATLDRWPSDAPPVEQFRTYWARLERFARRERPKARFLEAAPPGFTLDADSLALRQQLAARSAALISGWRSASGLPPPSVEVVGALIHGTFWGVAELDVSARRRARLVREARDAVWRAIAQ